MNVLDTLNATARGKARQPEPASSEMNKDDFLRLLTTQLAQQDPMNPTDNQAFVSQLSQMATVERLENLSSSVADMAMAQSANTSAQIVSFIGQDVRVNSNVVSVENGSASEVGFTLGGEADTVTVTVRDEDGDVVATVELGGRDKGEHSFEWDGRDKNGNPVEDGNYTFQISATDEDTSVASSTYGVKRVKGVTFEKGFPRLMFGDDEVATLGDVIEVVDNSDEA